MKQTQERELIQDALMIESSQTIDSAIPEFYKVGVLYMDQEYLLEATN